MKFGFNYHRIDKCDMNNGEGLGVVLWLAGCPHKCEGCHNPQTWSEYSGKPYDYREEDELLKALKEPYVTRVTFSGGDPLGTNNKQYYIRYITKIIKEKYPHIKIWVYTGYLYEDIDKYILEYVDVLVDGKYEKDLPTKKKWRGSDNQRLLILKNGNIIKED